MRRIAFGRAPAALQQARHEVGVIDGVGERTLRRWLTDDEGFKAAYDAARRSTYEAAMGRIPALTVKAVETLEDLLADTKHPAIRLGAARTIAEIGMHHYDVEAIARRLDAIEAAQGRR